MLCACAYQTITKLLSSLCHILYKVRAVVAAILAWRDTTSHSEDLNSQEHGTERSHSEGDGWLRVALVGIGPSCFHVVSDVSNKACLIYPNLSNHMR